MNARGKIWLLALVLGAGFLAGLLQRKPAAEPSAMVAEQAAPRPAEVVLQVRQGQSSPAASLYDDERPAPAPAASFTGKVERPPVLTPPETPPPLPARFEPLLPPIDALLGPRWARPLAEIHGVTPRNAAPENDVRRHRLADGDTLTELARRYLGSADRAREIFEANTNVLTSPDVLPLGVEIRIPAAESPAAELLPVPPETE